MPVFAVMLRGENFEITLDQGPSRFGFFTTRFVRAKDEQEAEHLAVALVRKHKGLRAGTRPDSAHTPTERAALSSNVRFLCNVEVSIALNEVSQALVV
jgi:hypothetical protein